MFDTSRQTIIKQISENRGNSKVITYIMSDRAPFNTQIADDVIPILRRHLENNKSKTVSLILLTRGGNLIAPLRIVKLLRNYCSRLEILIPYNAHSAGTLLALGGDLIVMAKLGELSPVDPTTGHPFNPSDPTSKRKMAISVEDVNSYLLLAKEKAGITKKDMKDVYSYLVNNIHKEHALHPLALGNIYRGQRMARMLIKKLLNLHMKGWFSTIKIAKIVNELSGNITIHNYPVMRDEAKKMGLPVEYASEELEGLLWRLLSNYAKIMELGKPFNPIEVLGKDDTREFKYVGAFIESESLLDAFIFHGNLVRSEAKKVGINIGPSRWETIK